MKMTHCVIFGLTCLWISHSITQLHHAECVREVSHCSVLYWTKQEQARLEPGTPSTAC